MQFNIPSLSGFVNLVKEKLKFAPDDQVALKRIYNQSVFRQSQDLRDWNQAVQSAESVVTPSRQLLYRMYKNIEIDTHLSSVVNSRRLKAISTPFRVVDATGKEDSTKTALFEATWFQQVLELMWDANLYGYSLIQLNDLTPDLKFKTVELVPRENVRPTNTSVIKYPGDREGYDYSQDDWLVGVGKAQDLGIYLKAARVILFKEMSLAAWAQFVEMFGMPLRMGKTDMSDPERAKAMYKMLAEMGSAGYGVLDKDDEVEFISAASTAGGTVGPHNALINYIDAQVSKLIWGQTMMSDNGSSRSQSEVHERLSDEYVQQDQRTLTGYVNDSLIPRLIALGFPLEGYRFEFFQLENTEMLFEQAVELLKTGAYTIEPKWFLEKFGIPLEKAETKALPVANEPAAV